MNTIPLKTHILMFAAALPLTACAAPLGQAQTAVIAADQSGEAASRRAILGNLADRLEMAYLFPETGAQYAAHLRSRNITAAEAALPAEDFGALITSELQAIHTDGHLRLEAAEGPAGHQEGPPLGPPPAPPPANLVTHHANGIAYLRIDTMFGLEETMEELANLVSGMGAGDRLILDLRENRGGGLREMDFLFSHLFTQPTDLVVMEVRRVIFENDGMPFGENAAMQPVDAPEGLVRLMHRALPASQPRLGDSPVLVLTSSTTGSAAEHLALALQRTGRAILIGETTRGAAHFGGMLPVGHGFQAFIPAGRTFDPDTGVSWEGTGVQPDTTTSPDEALAYALAEFRLTGVAAEDYLAAVNQSPL